MARSSQDLLSHARDPLGVVDRRVSTGVGITGHPAPVEHRIASGPDDPVSGADVIAALRRVAAPSHGIAADAVFTDLPELCRRVPPASLGLSRGKFVALLAPLFGEFE